MMSRDVDVYRRRDVLQASSATLAGYTALGTLGAGRTQAQDSQATITFNNQQSDGESVTIASAETAIESRLIIVADEKNDQGINTLYGSLQLDPGAELSDRTVDLDKPIDETQVIRAEIRTVDGNDELLARGVATVAIGESIREPETRFIEADSTAGFNYPYYLHIPGEIRAGEVPLLVEPNNTGTTSDDFEEHRRSAEGLVQRGSPARQIADALRVPLLVPVFPRPRSEPVDWRHYTHQLDRDTLQLEDGPLERIDQQLLAMVDHAREEELADIDRTFREEIMLDGFSASGTFSDRFTVLHADRVLSVTAGGVNGMTLLPLEEAKGHTVRYHIGIADVESLTGDSVDLEALDETNQFLYFGAEDENDTLPFDDAWTSDDLRETARDVYGEDMHEDRFPFSQSAYDQQAIDAQFRLYEGIGHRHPQIKDLIEFHRRTLAGEDISDFGIDVSDGAAGFVVTEGPTAEFTIDTDEAVVGDTVSFDASESQRGDTAITTYAWDFGDETTATGESVTHSFEEPGTYTITLTVEDFYGETELTTEVLTVEPAPTPTPTPAQAQTATPRSSPTPTASSEDGADADTPTDSDSSSNGEATPGENGPGFGVGTAITALGSGAYVLKHRLTSSNE